jgi:hypothetical protein
MSDSDSDFQVDHVAKSVEGQWRKWGKSYLVPIYKLLTCQVNLKFDPPPGLLYISRVHGS